MSTFVICNQPHDGSTPVFRSEPILNRYYDNPNIGGEYSLIEVWEKNCVEMNTLYPTHKHWIEIITN